MPELDVADLPISIEFYVELFGFRVLFEREAERFAYLALGGAELMLQEAAGPGRRFRTAPLEWPFGRGANYQLAVANVDEIYERILAAGYEPLVAIEERWYQVDVVAVGGRWTAPGPTEAGNRQFVVADPDGYLWRPFTDLGVRSVSSDREGGR